jgi:S1-C subfamily serine protease
MGGGVALAGAEVTGLLDDTETVQVPVTALESSAPADFAQDRRLSVNEIYRRSAPGVVQITTTSIQDVEPDPFLNPFGFPEQRRQQALGSGFVMDTSGRIVTRRIPSSMRWSRTTNGRPAPGRLNGFRFRRASWPLRALCGTPAA